MTVPTFRATIVLATLTILSMTGAPASGEVLRLDRTVPDHLRATNLPMPPPPPLQPRTQYIRAQVVYRLPSNLPDVARSDPALSRLCQRGAFIQKTNGFYWARTPQRSYGVAFSGGANLVDPQNKRAPGKVYFFADQDSRCTVWAADQAPLMPHYVGPLPGD